MERQLGLEVLPIEIIGHIASYLNIEDIIACCAASPSMREAFSDDLIWKRHCNIEVIGHLKRSVCLVEPNFEWYDDEMSNLSTVTKWKRNYMMQAHLFKNWRHGRFKKYEFEFGLSSDVFCDSKVDFYENDHLFLHTLHIKEEKMLDEIWDVIDTPFLHSTFNLNFSQLGEVDLLDYYQIVRPKHKLVVAQRNVILVYDISLSSFTRIPLVHAFIFDRSEKCSSDIITHDETTFYHNTYFELAPQVEVIGCGGYFIGAVTSGEGLKCPVFHVWDIETGKKVEEVSVPLKHFAIGAFQLLASQNKKDIIVKLRVNMDRYTYHCYGYDLTKMAYSPFLVKVNYCDFTLFFGNFVVGAAAERLFIYSYETSQKLLIKKCNQQILKKTLTVVGNHLLFGTFENVVHVLDLCTLDVINKVKLGFTLYSLRTVCDRFVVINSTNSEVWEIGNTAKKLFKFPVDGSFAAVNQLCTKLAIKKENKIIILHFW